MWSASKGIDSLLGSRKIELRKEGAKMGIKDIAELVGQEQVYYKRSIYIQNESTEGLK